MRMRKTFKRNPRLRLSKNIRFLRMQKNLSQPELAAQAGVGATTIAHWENGRVGHSRQSRALEKLAAYFGVTVKQLKTVDYTTGLLLGAISSDPVPSLFSGAEPKTVRLVSGVERLQPESDVQVLMRMLSELESTVVALCKRVNFLEAEHTRIFGVKVPKEWA